MAARRLLIVTPDFPPGRGGIQVMSHRLAHHLGDWDVRVVTRAAGDPRHDGSLGMVVRRSRRFTSPRGDRLMLGTRALVEAARWRPDAVLNLHVITSPAAAAISRMLRTPLCQYLHGSEVLTYPWHTSLALARSHRVIAVSHFTARLASRGGAQLEQCTVIPPGVDISPGLLRNPDVHAERAKRPTVVTVGRLVAHKGHALMARALALVHQVLPAAQWVVIGDGPMREPLANQLRAAGLSSRVRMLGAVSDAERDDWLAQAHAFCMPGYALDGGRGGVEGFGIAYLEAGLHGLPAVAASAGGAPEAVIDQQTGLVVQPGDVRAVARALLRLLGDPPFAEQLGRQARARALSLAWPRVAHRVEQVLLDAGAPGPRP